ncbi:hypothetical protein B0T14DRAFT_507470 [Immersiella caudata]|uniref:Uncharacterized protein n=1 Tax=Immersiella caudata TaxID=314043 RepID=A0AA39XGM0_9PEZI|nr:hypothetical protein B0T14DRAFT_507470 [Immersiella caudata]
MRLSGSPLSPKTTNNHRLPQPDAQPACSSGSLGRQKIEDWVAKPPRRGYLSP